MTEKSVNDVKTSLSAVMSMCYGRNKLTCLLQLKNKKVCTKCVTEKASFKKAKVFQLAYGPIIIYPRDSLSLLAVNNEVNIYKYFFPLLGAKNEYVFMRKKEKRDTVLMYLCYHTGVSLIV